jgi:hypothetical protein
LIWIRLINEAANKMRAAACFVNYLWIPFTLHPISQSATKPSRGDKEIDPFLFSEIPNGKSALQRAWGFRSKRPGPAL